MNIVGMGKKLVDNTKSLVSNTFNYLTDTTNDVNKEKAFCELVTE
jgi:hypothetical protein